MDVSDGFVGDLTKMLRVSGATAEIDLTSLPLSPAARASIALDPSLFEVAATGGDDYELIASVPPENADVFESAASEAGIDVTRIGKVLEGAAPPRFLRGGETVSFAYGSFRHF